MKIPRIEDFDPAAAHALGSPMENLPRIEKPPAPAPHPAPAAFTPPAAPAPEIPIKITEPPRHRDTTTPRNHDTTTPRYHDTMLEQVRKAVRDFGKEAATHRFTLDEKKAIAELIYKFGQRDIRTSENEITRIAVNFILQDCRQNGTASVLDQVLKLLNE